MNKKFIVILLTFLLLCFISLSACTDNLNPADNQDSDDSQDAIVYEVNEQQWKEAFELAAGLGNKTFTLTGESKETKGTYFIQIEDAALWGGYDKREENGKITISECYYSMESNKCYGYYKVGNTWIKKYESQSINTRALKSMLMIPNVSFKDKFGNFTYDSVRNQYETDSIDTIYEYGERDGLIASIGIISKCIVKFENGKLVYVEIRGSSDGEYVTLTMSYTDFGTTKVVLPTEYVEESSH